MARKTHGLADRRPSPEDAYLTTAREIIVFADFKGTSGDDTIKGAEGDDTIDGRGGNDLLRGGGGDDVIHGGGGNDDMNGNEGDDTLYGDSGNNEIRGGVGDDIIYAGTGTDIIYGGPGRNIIRSGTEKTIVYSDMDSIDTVGRAGVWNVDLSGSSVGVIVFNHARRGDYSTIFLNGSQSSYVDQSSFLLGSGDDSFKTQRLTGFFVDAGAGHDTVNVDIRVSKYLHIALRTADDGSSVLETGYDFDVPRSTYRGFEDFVIDAGHRRGKVYVDGATLFDGSHLDLKAIRAELDFSTATEQVSFSVDGSNVGHVNGSSFRVSTYTIRLNDLGGSITASGALFGGAGDDILTATESYYRSTLKGGAGNDTLTGSAGADTMAGGVGNDTLDGGGGDDTLGGGADDDILNGSAGIDHLGGGAGSNTVNGGDGNDVIVSVAGAIDTVDGGIGTDTWSGDFSARQDGITLTWNGSLGASDGTSVTNVEQVSLVLGGGDDHVAVTDKSGNLLVVAAGAGSDVIDYTLTGNAVTVSLAQSGLQNTGGGGPEKITGFENIIGSAFDDILSGDGGTNMLNGGGGADVLTGGLGADLFGFTSLSDFSTSDDIDKLDRLTDFDHFEGDRIDLSAIDAGPNMDGDQAFSFIGTEPFDVNATGPGELRYSQSVSGYLLVQGDLNHDGKADFSFLVHNTALVASDLVL